jgi:S-DNA-T family DNA segregation ATPase FtsK/SpoIIIE
MGSVRNLRRDLVAVGILAALSYLLVSLATYDPADPVPALAAPLDQLYRADPTVFPTNARVRNACGRCGALLADLLFATFGFGAYYVLIGLAVLAIAMLVRGQLNSVWIRAVGWVMSLVGITALLHRGLADSVGLPLIGPGGYSGALCSGLLNANFGVTGSLILMITLTLIGVMFWTDYFVFRAIRWAAAPFFLGIKLSRDRRGASAPAASKACSVKDRNSDTRLETIPVRNMALRDDLNPPIRKSAAELDEDLDDEDDEAAVAGGDEDADKNGDLALPGAVVAGPPARTPLKSLASLVKGRPGPAPANAKNQRGDERQQVITALNHAATEQQLTEFELPAVDLLDPPSAVNFDEQRDDALRKARILEKTFVQFGYNVKVVDIETGPVIAQYELELEAGLRLAKITNLGDDLAIALRVPSVRIVAPIPGKNTVGIEVPNAARQVVRLREVMDRGAAKAGKMKIPLFLGQDVRGEPLVVDLASLPHLLIAGRTGTGKSVCLNAIITSILMTRRPDEVRMLMIDPKMVELSGYGRLPHLMHPVVTDMRKAEAILAWAVDKMEERYALLARAGVRHITSYNQLGEQELMQRLQPETAEERSGIPLSLPFIVIVADEMADLMMTAGKEVQQHIIRLAQKSRAVGIHLILATQKPTVDVITGLIKSNLPARIAFQVATRTDSQVVLDCNGAERLLGNGDMLFLWPGTSTLVRGQGTYLTDEEINSVTAAVSTGEQNFVHELVNMRVSDPNQEEPAGDWSHRDEVYPQAVEVVIREGRGSVSLLQRALGIGYGRAARLIDFMEQDGIVGTYAGSKSREVVMTMSQWQQMQSSPPPPGHPRNTGNTPTSSLGVIGRATSAQPPFDFADANDLEDEPVDEEAWNEDEGTSDWNEAADPSQGELDEDDDDYESDDDEAESEDKELDEADLPTRMARPHRRPSIRPLSADE